MSNSAMDMVIGAGGTRNAEQAVKHIRTAEQLTSSGDKPGAIAEYRRALHADSTNVDAMFQLAYLLDRIGEEEEAIGLYERVCEKPPAAINALINLGIMYEDQGDYVKAERCLRQVLETNPNHPRARLYMKDVQAAREMVVEEDDTRDILKRRALYDTPVTDFELSVRARTCLKKMNIRTLGDLLRITEAELLAYKNFGESSLIEIRKMLQAKGLRLGQGL